MHAHARTTHKRVRVCFSRLRTHACTTLQTACLAVDTGPGLKPSSTTYGSLVSGSLRSLPFVWQISCLVVWLPLLLNGIYGLHSSPCRGRKVVGNNVRTIDGSRILGTLLIGTLDQTSTHGQVYSIRWDYIVCTQIIFRWQLKPASITDGQTNR